MVKHPRRQMGPGDRPVTKRQASKRESCDAHAGIVHTAACCMARREFGDKFELTFSFKKNKFELTSTSCWSFLLQTQRIYIAPEEK